VAGFCKHGDEPSDYVKDGVIIPQLSDYFLLKKDSGQWN
jgi:hypothetical protein